MVESKNIVDNDSVTLAMEMCVAYVENIGPLATVVVDVVVVVVAAVGK